MSNIDELPDLAGDVRERAVPPPYEQVTRRVRARRLRTAAGTMAAAVIAVGGIAVWQNAATTAVAEPCRPRSRNRRTRPTRPPPAWRQVVDGTDSHPFEAEGTDDGSIAVVWRALEHPEPTFALVIREPDGSRARKAPRCAGVPHARPRRVGRPARPLGRGSSSSDGTWTDLGAARRSRASRAGGRRARRSGSTAGWLYSTRRTAAWSTVPLDGRSPTATSPRTASWRRALVERSRPRSSSHASDIMR